MENIAENTTVAVEENAGSIFDTLTSGFQGIIDFIMGIIEMIRTAIESITA